MVDCFGTFFTDAEIARIYFGYDAALLVSVTCVYIETVDEMCIRDRVIPSAPAFTGS